MTHICIIDANVSQPYHVGSVFERPLGGTEAAACYLSHALAQLGHQITFISHHPSVLQQYAGIQSLSLEERLDYIQTTRPDIVIEVARPAFGDDEAIHLAGVKRYLWVHLPHNHPMMRIFSFPSTIQKFDAIVFVGEWQCQQYIQYFALPVHKCVVIPNGISSHFQSLFTDEDDLVQHKNISKIPVLVYATAPHKGVEQLPAIVSLVQSKNHLACFEVYCSGDLHGGSQGGEEKYTQVYEDLSHMGNVSYSPVIPPQQLANVLKRAHVLVYPNLTWPDCAPLIILEALAAGCRVITSDMGGSPETMRGYGRVVACAPADSFVECFAQAIAIELSTLAADPRAWLNSAWEQHLQIRQLAWYFQAQKWSDLIMHIRKDKNSVPHSLTWKQRFQRWIHRSR